MMDPTAIPAFDLPPKVGEVAPCGGGVMLGRMGGAEDTGVVALPGVELAPVNVALSLDEAAAAADSGFSLVSVVPVFHSNPSTGRLP